jgi:phospholipid/cholesterol/gamma-HCH transport system substrate-binding protein
MQRMSPEAKVGLLVLAGLLLLVYMSFKVGKIGFGAGGGYTVTLELDNAAGLAREAEVLVAGIPVGIVQGIGLKDGRALLSLRLRDEVQLPVDSSGSLRTHGVLGEKYVEIVPGTSSRYLADGDTLAAGAPPGDLDRLVTNLNAISTDIKRVTERLANVLGNQEGEDNLREIVTGLRDTAVSLRQVVAENRETLRGTLENFAAVSGDLRELLAQNRSNIDESLANARTFTRTLAERTPAIARNLEELTGNLGAVVAENRDDFRASVANLRVASEKLSVTLDQVDALVTAANSPEGTLGKLIHDDSLHRELQDAVGELRTVLGRLEKGEGTLGKLLTDDTAYAELTEGLGSLRNISEKIDRGQGTLGKLVNEDSVHSNLNQTLEGITDFVAGTNRFQFELGYEGDYLAKLGEAKNTFGVEVRPRQDRFYYVALVDDPRGDQQTETTETTVTDETGTHVVREEQTVTRDKFKFSAQVGKRFSFLTLRGGVFESSGGVGADADFFSDRLRLTLEAFDFARDEGPPHLKLAARWTLLRNLFVTAGLDDFMDNKGRADYFVGGGIRFLDDDFKYLLSPAASAVK